MNIFEKNYWKSGRQAGMEGDGGACKDTSK